MNNYIVNVIDTRYDIPNPIVYNETFVIQAENIMILVDFL